VAQALSASQLRHLRPWLRPVSGTELLVVKRGVSSALQMTSRRSASRQCRMCRALRVCGRPRRYSRREM
jgi:hypothetical protein